MLRILFLFNSFCFSTTLWAQENFKQNDLYLEIGGNAFLTSINYERQLTKKPGLGMRLGVGMSYNLDAFLTLPMGLNYLFPLKKDNTFIDTGISITLVPERKSSEGDIGFVNLIPSIGYRKHTQQDFMWRIGFTPIVSKDAFAPWAGFSIGKRF